MLLRLFPNLHRLRLSSWFAYRDPMLLFARAKLTERHLELSGWQLTGRHRRQIPVDKIVHVDVTGPRSLVLWLADGEVIRLTIENAAAWRQELSRTPNTNTL